MQLLCIGQLRAPAPEQFAIEGLFSGPQLNRFPGDGATEWTGRIRNAELMACATQNEVADEENPDSGKASGHLLQPH